MDIRTETTLKALTNKMPVPQSTVEISDNDFRRILMDQDLMVVEKHFHNHLETNQVLFVIKNGEIDYVAVKEVTADGTRIYKEV